MTKSAKTREAAVAIAASPGMTAVRTPEECAASLVQSLGFASADRVLMEGPLNNLTEALGAKRAAISLIQINQTPIPGARKFSALGQ